jgi:hypothetical protein
MHRRLGGGEGGASWWLGGSSTMEASSPTCVLAVEASWWPRKVKWSHGAALVCSRLGGEVWRSELGGGTVMAAAERQRSIIGSVRFAGNEKGKMMRWRPNRKSSRRAQDKLACSDGPGRGRPPRVTVHGAGPSAGLPGRGTLAYGPAETSRLVRVHHTGVEESVRRRARRVTRVARTTSHAGRGRGDAGALRQIYVI